MNYIDGFLVPVPKEKKEAYIELAKLSAEIYKEHGALRIVESWGDDIPAGKINDFTTAVMLGKEECIVFSWVEWPSKEARDIGNKKVMEDPRLTGITDLPFSGARMIWGGFFKLLET